MNENHAVCASPDWAEHLHQDVLAELLGGVELGEELLEIGPGPGAATSWLKNRVRRLVAIEEDPEAAQRLRSRFANSNVEVFVGDGADLAFPDESFDSVGMFTMLHHVPTLALQNRLLGEAFRVLRPGGVLVGSDSLASNELHAFHADDIYFPVEPSALLARLQTLGFGSVTVSVSEDIRFVAHKVLLPSDS